MKPLVVALMLTLAGAAAAAADTPTARRLAAEMLRQAAERDPAASARLAQVAQALDRGDITLAEAETLVRLAQAVGAAAPAGHAPAGQPARLQEPAAVLAALEAPAPSPAPAAPMPLEAPAQRSLPAEPTAAPASASAPLERPAPASITPAGQGTPALPADQRGGPTGGVAILSTRVVGNDVLIGLAPGAELAKGQRYRIERDGRTRVLAVVFRADAEAVWATTIASTWAPDASDRSVATSDRAVLDR